MALLHRIFATLAIAAQLGGCAADADQDHGAKNEGQGSGSTTERMHVLFSGVSTHVSSVYGLGHELIAQGHRVSFCLIPTDWRSALKEFGKYGAAVTNICSIDLTPEEEAAEFEALRQQVEATQWMDPVGSAFAMQIFAFYGMRRTSNFLYPTLMESVEKMAPGDRPTILVGDTFLTSLFDAAEKLGMRAVGIDMGAGECSLEQDHASKFMLPYTGRHLTYKDRVISNLIHWMAPLLRLPNTIWANVERHSRGLPLLHEYGDYWLRIPMIAPLRVPETVEPQYRQPSYEFLGAMHASAAPPALEGHFKEWMDRVQKQGKSVVYVSFGTNLVVDQRMADLLAGGIEGASKEKIAVIWSVPKRRWHVLPESVRPSGDGVPDTSKDILVVPFAPQQSLLAHPAVKAFVSHGGLNSLVESLVAGKPLVVIPFAGDQPHNAALVDARGAGIMLDKYEATPESLLAAIASVQRDPTYTAKAKLLGQLLVDGGGAKKGVRVLERLSQGLYDKRLPIGPQLPLYERLWLDVYALYAAVGCGVLLVLLLLRKLLCCGRKAQTRKSKDE